MINNSRKQLHLSRKSILLAFVTIYLLGFSGGLFLYPFIGYQGLIAFGALVLGVLLIIVAVSQR